MNRGLPMKRKMENLVKIRRDIGRSCGPEAVGDAVGPGRTCYRRVRHQPSLGVVYFVFCQFTR